MYAKMAQWFEHGTPEPEPAVQLQAGTLKFFKFVFVLFCFIPTGHLESDNCLFFFSFKAAHVLKNIQPCL